MSTGLPTLAMALSFDEPRPFNENDPSEPLGGPSRVRPRVLLVDDSLTLQMTLQDALIAAGFSVVTCKNGAEARQALRCGSYALMIFDVMLPDASGVMLAQEVRAYGPTSRVPIILLSADAEIGQRVNGVASGADEFIGKFCGPSYVVKRARQLALGQAAEVAELGGPSRVLIVDDSPTFLDAFAARVRLDGHDVVVSKSGTAALDYMAVQRVDAVVLDVFMPGLSGLEMCRRIKSTSAWADIPVMIMTSREENAALASGTMAGVDDFILKTQGVAAMTTRLSKLLQRGRAGGGRSGPKTPPEGARRISASTPPPAVAGGRASARGDAVTAAVIPMARRSEPPRSLVRPVPAQRTGAGQDQRVARHALPLFERVVAMSGLSSFIARSSLDRALTRAGVEAFLLTPEDLTRALPEIRWALSVFLPPEEMEQRMAAITALARP